MSKDYIYTAKEFIEKLEDCAAHKTLYVLGCFGAPMTSKNKTRYKNNNDYNHTVTRSNMIDRATPDTFGFDCIGLVKGILWGWYGDTSRTYGGAGYKVNDVPDTDAKKMLNYCTDVSTDFSRIQAGEFVWLDGHCGVYIGNGQVIESSPKWKNGVQYSFMANVGCTSGNSRTWTKHGKLKWIDYGTASGLTPIPTGTIHTVVRGDTLSKIAIKYRTTVEKIVADNIATYPKMTKNYIVVGWKLKV